jgi:hypothetical protein
VELTFTAGTFAKRNLRSGASGGGQLRHPSYKGVSFGEKDRIIFSLEAIAACETSYPLPADAVQPPRR